MKTKTKNMQKALTNEFSMNVRNKICPYYDICREIIYISIELGVLFKDICKDNDTNKFNVHEVYQFLLMLQLLMYCQCNPDFGYTKRNVNLFNDEHCKRLKFHENMLSSKCFKRGDIFLKRPPKNSGFDFILTDGFGIEHNIQISEFLIQDMINEDISENIKKVENKINKQADDVKIFISSLTPTDLSQLENTYKHNENVYIIDTHQFNIFARVMGDSKGNNIYCYEAMLGNRFKNTFV